MAGDFVGIFTGMGVATIVLLAVGIALLFVEFFLPGFGVFGFSGIICVLLGIIFRGVLDGGSFFQVAILTLLLLAFLAICWVILFWSMRRGVLSRSPLVQNKTAIPKDYDAMDAERAGLRGKRGTIVADCKPMGKAEIGGKTYNVCANSGYLVKGTIVEVVSVTIELITVEKVKADTINV